MTYAERFNQVAIEHHGDIVAPESPFYHPDEDRYLHAHIAMDFGCWNGVTKIQHLEGIDIYVDTKQPYENRP